MDFQEIKQRFEASLMLELGAEQPFRVVGDEEWQGRCPDREYTHLDDIPRACFGCYRIHAPRSEYEDFTEARIGASVEMIVERLEEEKSDGQVSGWQN
ncbi:MAG: hypothetical protein V1724_01550 [Chloroflexota bacterium]